MNRFELNAKIDLFERELEWLQDIKESVSCQNCKHWGSTICRKYEMTPPDEVVRAGCDDWDERDEDEAPAPPPPPPPPPPRFNKPVQATPRVATFVPPQARANYADFDDDIPF